VTLRCVSWRTTRRHPESAASRLREPKVLRDLGQIDGQRSLSLSTNLEKMPLFPEMGLQKEADAAAKKPPGAALRPRAARCATSSPSKGFLRIPPARTLVRHQSACTKPIYSHMPDIGPIRKTVRPALGVSTPTSEPNHPPKRATRFGWVPFGRRRAYCLRAGPFSPINSAKNPLARIFISCKIPKSRRAPGYSPNLADVGRSRTAARRKNLRVVIKPGLTLVGW